MPSLFRTFHIGHHSGVTYLDGAVVTEQQVNQSVDRLAPFSPELSPLFEGIILVHCVGEVFQDTLSLGRHIRELRFYVVFRRVQYNNCVREYRLVRGRLDRRGSPFYQPLKDMLNDTSNDISRL
jgi:hypothetical protein